MHTGVGNGCTHAPCLVFVAVNAVVHVDVVIIAATVETIRLSMALIVEQGQGRDGFVAVDPEVLELVVFLARANDDVLWIVPPVRVLEPHQALGAI